MSRLGAIGQHRLLSVLALAALAGWLGEPVTGALPGTERDGWTRLSHAQLEALAATSLAVRLGETDVIYHISPSGRDVQVHYPSMFYRTRYRRKVDDGFHCYYPAALPFTGWRCYSVWRKEGIVRELPSASFNG